MERDHLPPIREEPDEVATISIDQIEVRKYVGGLIKSFERKVAWDNWEDCRSSLGYKYYGCCLQQSENSKLIEETRISKEQGTEIR